MRPIRLFILFSLTFLTGHSLLFSQAQDKALPYYRAGNQLYSQKKYDDALKYYDAATQLDPNDWAAYQGEGNCYYAKGEKAQSISYYQKSLSLHRDNPGLQAFVDSLRAELNKTQTKTEDSDKDKEILRYMRRSSGITDSEFDLIPTLGIDLSPPLNGTALGGSLSGFYMFDANFGLGGAFRFFYYDETDVQHVPYSGSSGPGTETITTTDSMQYSELCALLKYRFDGSWIFPYFLGGPSFSLVSASEDQTYGFDSNNPPTTNIPPNWHLANSKNYLGWEFGGGVEIPLEPKLKIVVESRFEGYFADQYSSSTIRWPIEVGLSFVM